MSTGPIPTSTQRASSAASWANPRNELAKAIPRRLGVTWWIGIVLAAAFALVIWPLATADRWIAATGAGRVEVGKPASITSRVPPLSGYDTRIGHIGGGGVVLGRGDIAQSDDADRVSAVQEAIPHGWTPYLAFLVIPGVLAGLFTHHTRRSNSGRLLRVQLINLGLIAAAAIVVKVLMLATSLSVLAIPVALFALVPTLALDRVVGLATGILAALIFAMLVPFDVGVAILLLVQTGAAGIVVAERPKARWRAALIAGAVATVFSGVTYLLLVYLTTGHLPALSDPLHSAWLAAIVGPAIATALAVPAIPIYQLLVGEITQNRLVELEDLSHPLLRQIAVKAPGTWQHSLMMANMAEIAANAIGASGRLVRVGAYFHDLGKSLQPKYFIENLEPGETSPHDRLPPEVSCDAIFAHVTEGIVTARNAGLHERIVDFMHMHHGNGVLEYFWAKTKEQGNPKGLTIEQFRYPGVPPQSRETAILAICDAVEAASRTLKKPDPQSIDNLVQRIVYGKLHLGQLDESGLSMADLRRVSDSLKETIRHANHGRIEYPWQKAQQDASASVEAMRTTSPRLDSLDRPARPDTVRPATPTDDLAAVETGNVATPKLRVGHPSASPDIGIDTTAQVDGSARHQVPMIVKDTPSGATIRPRARTLDDARVRELDERDEKSGVHRMGQRRDSDEDVIRSISRRAPTGSNVISRPPTATDGVGGRAASNSDAVVELGRSGPSELAAFPSSADSDPPAARKRAATLPPVQMRRSPTVPPLVTMKPPTEPPPIAAGRSPTRPSVPAITQGRTPSTPPPPPGAKPPTAFASSTPSPQPDLAPAAAMPRTPFAPDEAVTIPPRARREAVIIDDPAASGRKTAPRVATPDDASTTQPRIVRDDDATRTQPRMMRAETERDADQGAAIAAAHPAAGLPDPDSTWARGLAARIDAAIDDDFGGETPVMAPTKAELQALLGTPPDPTVIQPLEELERLHRAARERRSEPILERRHAPQTAEVGDDDIEAAIELAPPARRSTIGIAKKKPTE